VIVGALLLAPSLSGVRDACDTTTAPRWSKDFFSDIAAVPGSIAPWMFAHGTGYNLPQVAHA
jgi:hypothetical protein